MGHPRRKVAGMGKGVAAPSCDGVVRASGPKDFQAALRQCRRRIVHVRSEKVPVPSGHGPEAGHIGTYPVMGSELRCAEAALRHQTVGGTGLRSPRRRDEGVEQVGWEPGSMRRAAVDHLSKTTASSAEPHGRRKPTYAIARSVCLAREGCVSTTGRVSPRHDASQTGRYAHHPLHWEGGRVSRSPT